MEPSYTPRRWHLAVTALIALLGAAVLYMVLNPRVDAAYRAYYIDRTASCFPRLASGYYRLGQPASFVAGRNGPKTDSIRWCGFMPAKTDGIKSFGDYGILRLKFPIPDEDLLLTFSSWANTSASKPAREVEVLVNDQKVGTITFTTAQRVNGRMVIPQQVAAASGPDGMQIKFAVPRIGPPGTNSEPVTLQLRLEAVRLVPLSKAPPPAATLLGVIATEAPGETWAQKRGGVAPASALPE